MSHFQKKSPWEVIHMYLITTLPPSGYKTYNLCLVIVKRNRKTPIFLPYHKYDTSVDPDLLLWNRVICHIRLFKNIIHDRYTKFKSALWTNTHKLFGTRLSFYIAHQTETDALTEGMIQDLEEMIRRFSAYGL
ncbi:hypothetical protein O181_060292 [Austropuccinia psidii MF-1]|uniref:Uncharacterized protein n=1 Tax=Austropuccinia psidii MF-1 TaxID=1389203 RepID=A0A9Q3ENC0_9BASI|nr:hypothetical protein [Austropuccinia psidii MF-1]